MNHPARRLSGVLLALAMLTLPAAAHADPAARIPGTPDRWITSALDLLGGLVDGRWTVGAASGTDDAGTTALPLADGDSDAAPSGDENRIGPTSTTKAKPSWDPNG